MNDETPYHKCDEARLQQADILKGIRAFQLADFDNGQPVGRVQGYEFALVMSQDCDLEQDYSARFGTADAKNAADKLLFSVIMCGAYAEASLKAGTHREGATSFNSKEWKQVRQNNSRAISTLGKYPAFQNRWWWTSKTTSSCQVISSMQS